MTYHCCPLWDETGSVCISSCVVRDTAEVCDMTRQGLELPITTQVTRT